MVVITIFFAFLGVEQGQEIPCQVLRPEGQTNFFLLKFAMEFSTLKVHL